MIQGDQREQKAEIILRRKYVGASSNDIGFKLQEDGTWEAIISEYDKHRFNTVWLNNLSQQYALNKVKDLAALHGYTIETEENIKGEIHLSIGGNF